MAFQGSLKELPLPDVIQLVAVSGKSGAFLIEDRAGKGKIFLRDGHIVHAEVGALAGEDAVYELATWTEGEFKFDTNQTASSDTIEKSNTNILMEAARRIDEWRVLAKKIPSTQLVPVFVEHRGSGSVSFSPPEWRVIQKIDERRTVDAIAEALRESSFETGKVIFGLITSGFVTLEDEPPT